ncbi:MAG: isochorismatase family cysteine hydrolase [Thermoplasmata archaeon]|nr:isochorismatase family cysteine hydrolase [Thermoplasmata archaeon]
MIKSIDIEDKSLALVVVDMQNKFAAGELEAPARGILPTVNSAIAMFRSAGRPAVFVAMDGEGHGIPEGMEDPHGFVEGLDIRPEDAVVHKSEMSAFCRTELADVLHGMGADGIVVCGLVSRWCIISTYFGAYDHDICPYLLAGGSASSDPADTRNVEAVCRTVTFDDIRTNRAFRARGSY